MNATVPTFEHMPLPWDSLPTELGYATALWAFLVQNFSHHTLLIYFTMVVAVASTLLFSVPCFFIEIIPFFQKWKIQPDAVMNRTRYIKLVAVLFVNYAFMITPLIFVSYPFFRWVGFSTSLPLPSLLEVIKFNAIAFVIEDFCHYVLHRWMHEWKACYKWIHSVHHEHSAPVGLAATYAHPIEVLVLGFGTFLPVILFAPHLVTMWSWIAMRQLEAVAVHSGYDLPFTPEKLIPFYGGADFHDWHHHHLRGNFASTFTWWDRMFNTDLRFNAMKARDAEKKAQ